jgi:hypothetical protein
MPKIRLDMQLGGTRKVAELARNLRRAGDGELADELHRRIQQEASPVVAALRAAVMRVEVSSTKGGLAPPTRRRGLRLHTAAATGFRVLSDGVRFEVDPGQMRHDGWPGDMPTYLDASVGHYGRWLHPVFGNMSVWTIQRGSAWFFRTIRDHFDDFRRGIRDVMHDIAQEITK